MALRFLRYASEHLLLVITTKLTPFLKLGSKIEIYGLSGFGAALAGLVQSSQVHTSAAVYGEFGTELDVIAAIVLGGTSLMGVVFLGVINNGKNTLNVQFDIQLIAKGVIIVLAMALSEIK
jgi:ribose/xylose/arabinose/galactoside ABC-type transport system permease subunit